MRSARTPPASSRGLGHGVQGAQSPHSARLSSRSTASVPVHRRGTTPLALALGRPAACAASPPASLFSESLAKGSPRAPLNRVVCQPLGPQGGTSQGPAPLPLTFGPPLCCGAGRGGGGCGRWCGEPRHSTRGGGEGAAPVYCALPCDGDVWAMTTELSSRPRKTAAAAAPSGTGDGACGLYPPRPPL